LGAFSFSFHAQAAPVYFQNDPSTLITSYNGLGQYISSSQSVTITATTTLTTIAVYAATPSSATTTIAVYAENRLGSVICAWTTQINQSMAAYILTPLNYLSGYDLSSCTINPGTYTLGVSISEVSGGSVKTQGSSSSGADIYYFVSSGTALPSGQTFYLSGASTTITAFSLSGAQSVCENQFGVNIIASNLCFLAGYFFI